MWCLAKGGLGCGWRTSGTSSSWCPQLSRLLPGSFNIKMKSNNEPFGFGLEAFAPSPLLVSSTHMSTFLRHSHEKWAWYLNFFFNDSRGYMSPGMAGLSIRDTNFRAHLKHAGLRNGLIDSCRWIGTPEVGWTKEPKPRGSIIGTSFNIVYK